jgi:prevent-host-death family protein
MCYAAPMERIALRELRNHASRVVRRASSGERIIITVDGVPTAQIVPLDTASLPPTLEDLVSQGRLIAPRTTTPAPATAPMPGRQGVRLSDIVDDLRDG